MKGDGSIIGMVIFRYAIWALFAIPTVIFAVLLQYSPKTILGDESLSASLVLSLIGAVLSYYGLLFSSYAAIEVRNLSNRYFFKLRSPQILKKLKNVSRAVESFSSELAVELRSQQFFFEVPVLLRAANRMNNIDVRRVAKEADVVLKNLKMVAATHNDGQATAGQVQGYWDFYQKISELADEMSAQIQDIRAME